MAIDWVKFLTTEKLRDKIKLDLLKYKISLEPDEIEKLLGKNMANELPRFLDDWFYNLCFCEISWSMELNQQSGKLIFSELGGQTFVKYDGDGGPEIIEAGPFVTAEEAAKLYEDQLSFSTLNPEYDPESSEHQFSEDGGEFSCGYSIQHPSFSEERAEYITGIICKD